MSDTFDSFFEQATGQCPYPYQSRLAEQRTLSRLLDVPTGCGKTAAAIVTWLWRLRTDPDSTPHRLAYCLPMRTLVEQTGNEARKWMDNLRRSVWPQLDLSVYTVMGGEVEEGWELSPEKPALIVGTQDMLLSRALNRGYGMSRYRWPVHFGLLNNDCLWVMDETQLMGVGVETTAQLAGLREKLGTAGISASLWMSATLQRSRLTTVDSSAAGWPVLELEEADLAAPAIQKKVGASKPVRKLDFVLDKTTTKTYARDCGRMVLAEHQSGTLTLVVVNRVERAQQIFEQLLRQGRTIDNTALIHSRFRRSDRAGQEGILFSQGDRIVIATQAVEAGLDISARALFTELAPWSSLVQRFGRCNRYGEFPQAAAMWIDIATADGDLSTPYDAEQLQTARDALASVTDVGPASLKRISVAEPSTVRPVLRRKDLLDLFDTTPDICGNDLDISRYVRETEDTDTQVFWRKLGGEMPSDNEADPFRDELVRVSVNGLRNFAEKKPKPRIWRWDPVDEHWTQATQIRPGQTYLIDQESGGYAERLGWTGSREDLPNVIASPSPSELDSNGSNRPSFLGKWVELAEHQQHVVDQVVSVTTGQGLSPSVTEALHSAARWHDVGKAHPCFQQMLSESGEAPPSPGPWAKSKSSRQGRRKPKGFRHELASALAWLELAPKDGINRDLVAYLIAAHHGRIRLSIRSLPNEDPPPDDRLFARGVYQGDELEVVLPGEQDRTKISLDLSLMRMGEGRRGDSWLARMLRLRDDPAIGPFRLAYWEALLRAADRRASELEVTNR